MKRTCLKLNYQFSFNIQSIGESVVFKPGNTWLNLAPEKAELSSSTKDENAGVYVKKVLSLTIEESELVISPVSGAPLILEVSFEDESKEIIGRLQYPAKITNCNTENGFHKITIAQTTPI